MRLIKCSAEDYELADDAMMRTFFEKTLPERKTFNFGSQIGANGLYAGETLLFQYDAKLRYIAKSASARIANPAGTDYQNYFLVDTDSLYHTEEIHYSKLEELFKDAGLEKSLEGPGWTILPNSEVAEQVVAKLVREKVNVNNLSDGEEEIIAVAAGKAAGPRFQSNVEKKIATELRAMEMARAHFNHTWDTVEDVSSRQPYDLHCRKSDGRELRVEVKGTTGDGSVLLLTRGEVDNALQFDVALYVVTFINLVQTEAGIRAEGGVPIVYDPWRLKQEHLSALSFKYAVRD